MKNKNLTLGLWYGILLFGLYLIFYYTPGSLPLAQFISGICVFAGALVGGVMIVEGNREERIMLGNCVALLIVGSMILAAMGTEWLVYLGFPEENLKATNAFWLIYPSLLFFFSLWGLVIWKSLLIFKFVAKDTKEDPEGFDDAVKSIITLVVATVLILCFQKIIQ